MQELIRISDEKRVDGRELHKFLQIETPFKKWIDRMLEHGFTEEVDFWTKMSKASPSLASYLHVFARELFPEHTTHPLSLPHR
jgi:anti-repressor protein